MNDWALSQSNTAVILAQAHGDEHATPHQAETHHASEAVPVAGPLPAEHAAPHSASEPSSWLFFGFSGLAFLLLAVFAILGMRRRRLVPNGLQSFWEMIIESVFGIPELVMGARGRQYAPFVATFFLYIAVMNFMGLVPAFKPGTASLSVTLGLAIVAFIGVQYFGFRAHGIRYFAHFLGPVPAMAFLILPLELVAELIRPVSLSVRLYGNIFGEEQVVMALANQLSPIAAIIMLPLQVLASILQAFVFTLLVTVYIALATEKHDEEHEGASHA